MHSIPSATVLMFNFWVISKIFSVICAVDCFKLYNDTYGHLAGDDALRLVSGAIAQTAKRPADLVARYGGEEFVVLLPNTDAAGAIVVAQAIQENIRDLRIPHISSQVSEYITLSLGVATIVPRTDLPSAALVMSADQGLYQAKAQGRNSLFQVKLESEQGQ